MPQLLKAFLSIFLGLVLHILLYGLNMSLTIGTLLGRAGLNGTCGSKGMASCTVLTKALLVFSLGFEAMLACITQTMLPRNNLDEDY